MDFTRCLRSRRANRDSPCTHFFHTSGEVSLQIQQLITCADNAVQTRFFQAHFCHELVTVSIVKFSNIRLNGGTHSNNHRTFGSGDFAHFVEIWVVFVTVFIDVRDIHRWFQRQEAQVFDSRFVFVGQRKCTQHTGVLKLWQTFFQRSQFSFCVFIAAFSFLLHTVNRTLTGIEVRKRQLGINDFDVIGWINFIVHVNDVVVFKTTHNVADSFGFTDVGQELVTQAFTFGCAFHQTGDINEFHGGRQNALWFNDFG
ncbi:hypothetical protein D3C75_484850 [compost metagenome]